MNAYVYPPWLPEQDSKDRLPIQWPKSRVYNSTGASSLIRGASTLHEFPALFIGAQSGLDQGILLKITLTHRTRSSDSSEQDWAVRQHELLLVTGDSGRTLQIYILELSLVFNKVPKPQYFMLFHFPAHFRATLIALYLYFRLLHLGNS